MSEVTLDAGAMAQLKDAREYLKLRDSTGAVIGYFLPADRAASEVVFGVKSPHAREEIERRLREEAAGAKPLASFWAEMHERHPDEFR